jgi:hypothetical protein
MRVEVKSPKPCCVTRDAVPSMARARAPTPLPAFTQWRSRSSASGNRMNGVRRVQINVDQTRDLIIAARPREEGAPHSRQPSMPIGMPDQPASRATSPHSATRSKQPSCPRQRIISILSQSTGFAGTVERRSRQLIADGAGVCWRLRYAHLRRSPTSRAERGFGGIGEIPTLVDLSPRRPGGAAP